MKFDENMTVEEFEKELNKKNPNPIIFIQMALDGKILLDKGKTMKELGINASRKISLISTQRQQQQTSLEYEDTEAVPKRMKVKTKDKIKRNEIANYHGRPLIGYEYNVLIELEDLIGEILPNPKLDPQMESHFASIPGIKIKDSSIAIFSPPFFKTQDNHIVQLSLYGTSLTSIPESVCTLTSLTSLFINDSLLISFPESIGKLTSLGELALNSNQLSSLPDSIGNLTTLTTLNLSWNKLSILPKSISSLTSLTFLDLTSNKLTSLLESIGNLTSLETLNLMFNHLTSLPESIGNLISLEKLELMHNQLTSLPESISNLQSLNYLDLRDNQLISLPESIGNLTSLETLQLGGNQLTSLPESIGNLTSLYYLDLTQNKLTSLPDVVEKALKKLEKNGCKIQGLDEERVQKKKKKMTGPMLDQAWFELAKANASISRKKYQKALSELENALSHFNELGREKEISMVEVKIQNLKTKMKEA